MLIDFINRERELEFLQGRYESGMSEFIVLYGRRRIGKTELVKKFLRGKKAAYHLVARESEKDQIDEFHRTVAGTFPELADMQKDWEIILKRLGGMGRVVLAIDEFQYLIETNPEILKRFQKIWDEHLSGSDIMLVLTGSSVGMMETEVIGSKSPLYGRRTGQWNLKPFGFGEAARFFPNYSMEDRIRAYSILGGTPFFLRQFDPRKNLEHNILTGILHPGALLREEAVNLLREEFREPRNYFSILKAVAAGNTDFGSISNDTGIPRNSITKYLFVLQDLRLLERALPVTASVKSKKARYFICDNYLSYWFCFIFPNQSSIEYDPEGFLGDVMMPNLDIHTSLKFEGVCREAVNRKGMGYPKLGNWWYGEDEIDMVGLNERAGKMLFGECKWTKGRMSAGHLGKLESKAEKVRWKAGDRREEFALFSRSGFTGDLKRLASERDDVSLFDLRSIEDIFGRQDRQRGQVEQKTGEKGR